MNTIKDLRVEQLRDGHVLILGDYACRYRVHRIRKCIDDISGSPVKAVAVLVSRLDRPMHPLEEFAFPLGFVVAVAML